jgi:hypothetical protein
MDSSASSANDKELTSTMAALLLASNGPDHRADSLPPLPDTPPTSKVRFPRGMSGTGAWGGPGPLCNSATPPHHPAPHPPGHHPEAFVKVNNSRALPPTPPSLPWSHTQSQPPDPPTSHPPAPARSLPWPAWEKASSGSEFPHPQPACPGPHSNPDRPQAKAISDDIRRGASCPGKCYLTHLEYWIFLEEQFYISTLYRFS